MKSTSLPLSFAAIAALLSGCQSSDANESKTATAQAGALPARFAQVPQTEVTAAYKADVEKLCDVIRLSGAPEDDAMTLTTANWLAANLTTQESRKFLVAIQPLVGADKADVLDFEAKRVGLSSCALADLWRKPPAPTEPPAEPATP